MEKLDEFKKKWNSKTEVSVALDEVAMNKIVKSRVGKQTRMAMKYFWASFGLQILVYALLSHVIVKYWNDLYTVMPAVVGIVIFIPFTKTLLNKFKSLAFMQIEGTGVSSIHRYVIRQKELLERFFIFKKRYELFLIPLSTMIGVLLTFKLYVPGGVMAHPYGAAVTLSISLVSCYMAIYQENRKNFRKPISELGSILKEYAAEEA